MVTGLVASTIKEYLRDELKNENAIPQLLIDGIANAINKKRWQIYSIVDDEYMHEDIDTVCNDRGVALDDEEVGEAYYRYQKVRENDDSMSYLYEIIDEIIEERNHGQNSNSL